MSVWSLLSEIAVVLFLVSVGGSRPVRCDANSFPFFLRENLLGTFPIVHCFVAILLRTLHDWEF